MRRCWLSCLTVFWKFESVAWREMRGAETEVTFLEEDDSADTGIDKISD